ncbi:MAG: tRNA guanosine(34) transglycosylase Tgt [Eubacteriales bacterium]
MFELITQDGEARRGTFSCPHGTAQTPVFMNVGTQAAIKGGVSAVDLKELGCQIELSNTYHLHLRPGDDTIKTMGGLHKFMNWEAPVLTDSGGFQVFSLSGMRKIKEEGVTFSSYLDGRKIFMGPEESMQIQCNLGGDVAMAFDECVENPATYNYVKQSCERTYRWLERCITAHQSYTKAPDCPNPEQQLFGINQGGTYPDLRIWHMKEIAKLQCDGFAIGGLAVGEPAEVMYKIIDAVAPYMPQDKPRYLMGVGTPSNIIEAVSRGVDFFDCVMPSRNARHGKLYTWEGTVHIKNLRFKTDDRPISPTCGCPVCRSHSRSYLRHLFASGEMLAQRLAVMHNLYFYNQLMERIRTAIETNTFAEFRETYSGKLELQINNLA